MLHSGLKVKQGLIVQLAIFIDSKTLFYVSFRSYSKTRSFYTNRDQTRYFGQRPNFMIYSGHYRPQTTFLRLCYRHRDPFLFFKDSETQFYVSFQRTTLYGLF